MYTSILCGINKNYIALSLCRYIKNLHLFTLNLLNPVCTVNLLLLKAQSVYEHISREQLDQKKKKNSYNNVTNRIFTIQAEAEVQSMQSIA